MPPRPSIRPKDKDYCLDFLCYSNWDSSWFISFIALLSFLVWDFIACWREDTVSEDSFSFLKASCDSTLRLSYDSYSIYWCDSWVLISKFNFSIVSSFIFDRSLKSLAYSSSVFSFLSNFSFSAVVFSSYSLLVISRLDRCVTFSYDLSSSCLNFVDIV